jgi:transporter family-2 protein
MSYFIVIALLGGIFVSMSRSINGRLSADRGAFSASFWNHLGGVLFLTVVILIFEGPVFGELSRAPAATMTGGIIGAGFVAISSYVFPRIGAGPSSVLIIGGQMIAGVLIDLIESAGPIGPVEIAGVVLVIAGMYVTGLSRRA